MQVTIKTIEEEDVGVLIKLDFQGSFEGGNQWDVRCWCPWLRRRSYGGQSSTEAVCIWVLCSSWRPCTRCTTSFEPPQTEIPARLAADHR